MTIIYYTFTLRLFFLFINKQQMKTPRKKANGHDDANTESWLGQIFFILWWQWEDSRRKRGLSDDDADGQNAKVRPVAEVTLFLS